jgi:hypothetical protein
VRGLDVRVREVLMVATAAVVSVACIAFVWVGSGRGVAKSDLEGSWMTLGRPDSAGPRLVSLRLAPDGTGSTVSEGVVPLAPTLGVPSSFRYQVSDGRVEFAYNDGGSDTMVIDTIGRFRLGATVEGPSNRIRGGVWIRVE